MGISAAGGCGMGDIRIVHRAARSTARHYGRAAVGCGACRGTAGITAAETPSPATVHPASAASSHQQPRGQARSRRACRHDHCPFHKHKTPTFILSCPRQRQRQRSHGDGGRRQIASEDQLHGAKEGSLGAGRWGKSQAVQGRTDLPSHS